MAATAQVMGRRAEGSLWAVESLFSIPVSCWTAIYRTPSPPHYVGCMNYM